MCLWVGRDKAQRQFIAGREREDVSAAMKVRSSRVTISTRSTPRRRRLMSRQIEINDWMGDSKLTRIDVVAGRKMAAAATLESRATMVELGARDDGREEQASLTMHFISKHIT